MSQYAHDPYTLPTVEFVGGSTQELVFRVYRAVDQRLFDLYSCTANFSVINYVNKTGTAVISKKMTIGEEESGGETVSDLLRVTLDSSETAELTGKFIYQITIQDVSGEVEIPGQGILYIFHNINRNS
jgi:hypothetical protein